MSDEDLRKQISYRMKGNNRLALMTPRIVNPFKGGPSMRGSTWKGDEDKQGGNRPTPSMHRGDLKRTTDLSR